MVTDGHDPAAFVSLRMQAGLSVAELATRAGVARNTLTEIERGERKPRMATVRAVAKALGKHPSDFLARSGRERASADEVSPS